MCGFVGVNSGYDRATIRSIASTMQHRGPDQHGEYLAERMSLGHRRLSIIDLEGGGQPISNEDGSLWIVFNGEMYNYREERAFLEQKGHVFKTNSDTEVVLHLVEEHATDAFARINGEFALAIWNEATGKLLLARDRFGIKPLYYYFRQNRLIFASEIRAILEFPEVERQLNVTRLAAYFHLRYNDGEESLFTGIRRLAPGSYLVYDGRDITTGRYYQFSYCETPEADISAGEAAEEVRGLLESSVRYRLMADVEVGLFLSSGLDSCAILSLASHFQQRIKAFTIGFGLGLDEVDGARRMAGRFEADFLPTEVTGSQFDLLHEIVTRFDEPIGDSIIIPTYLLCREASKSVKAVLTGEGADEVFGGYIHQLTFFYLQKYLRHIPPFLLHAINRLVELAPLRVLNLFFPYPESLQEDDRQKVARFLACAHDFCATRRNMIYLFDGTGFARGELAAAAATNVDETASPDGNYFSREIDLDMRGWLSYYTLYKQDTLTMAHSLEGRVPYLDHRLVEFLTRLPVHLFIDKGTVKMPLRRAMAGALPADLLKAKKKAFYFPYHQFFGSGFKAHIEEIHHEAAGDDRLREIINFDYFASLVARYPNLSLVNSKRLMVYLIFLIWYRHHFRRA